MSTPIKPKRKNGFSDPEVRKRATELSKGKPKPNRRRNSKKNLIHEAKVEIVKEELIKEGYLKYVNKHLPSVFKAQMELAKKPRGSATQERKLIFQSVGLIGKEQKEAAQTMGEVLTRLFSNAKPDEDDE